MTGQAIIEHIEALISKSTSNDALNVRLEQFAIERSITLGPNDKAGMAELAEGYVRAVANLLIECDIAATAAGIQRFTSPIIQTAASYFLNSNVYCRWQFLIKILANEEQILIGRSNVS